jgi:ferredoxin like protein
MNSGKPMGSGKIEDKLAVNNYAIDPEVHITIQEALCQQCDKRWCLHACPAGCYKLKDGRVTYSFEGCLECGSCRIVCGKGSVKWDLPRGGMGVCFEYG